MLGTQWLTVPALLFSWALIVLAFIESNTTCFPMRSPYRCCGWGYWLTASTALLPPRRPLSEPAQATSGSGWSIIFFRWITSREGFGYGDFKMLAAIGAWLGWALLPLVLCIAATVGAITGGLMMLVSRSGRGRVLPFGPFLAMAAWLVLLFGDSFISAYLLTSGMGR
ncbi:MAG: hypothetical protein CM1200mP41_23650 [Gammaproteobacteria bacterium]|nr:MAG: hypothetical protein CM1200mP41_23650 [Gammaproteobacteria bacterium]